MTAARARGKRNESRLPRLRRAAEDANMDYRVAEKELEIVARGYEVTLRSLRDQLLADASASWRAPSTLRQPPSTT